MPIIQGEIVIITLQCLGQIEGNRFLDGRTADGTVGLAPTGSDVKHFSGAQWQVFPQNDVDIIELKCQGSIKNPNFQFLEGRTRDGTVALAPGTGGEFTGRTRWKVTEITPGGTSRKGTITLECIGDFKNPQFRFLDGRTQDSTVGLAPETGGHFTGTHWHFEVVQFLP